MNAGLVHSELNFKYRLFCKTVSKSSNWGFDRLRLYYPKWHTRIRIIRPDGSVLTTKQFGGDTDFEHNFSFDLSENVNNEEYAVYIAGVAAAAKFQQVFAYPTGYGATYGKNAEITYWNLNIVSPEETGGAPGSLFLENQPLTQIQGISNIKAKSIRLQNCQLDAEQLADLIIAVDNSGITNGTFNYSGNNAAPAERALEAYNNLKNNKGWSLTGDVPADSLLLINEFPNAAAAWSLRKLRAEYSGNSILVRRSSDNTELGIGFSGGELDTVTLLNFVGQGDGFISALYDQSGLGLNLFQGSAASQPKIVLSGSLNIDNGKPAILFEGGQFLNGGDILKQGTKPHFSFSVAKFLNSTDEFGSIYSKTAYAAEQSRYAFSEGASSSTALMFSRASSGNDVKALVNKTENQTIFNGVIKPYSKLESYANNILGQSLDYLNNIGDSSFDFLVGAYANSSGSTPPEKFFEGSLQELIIYQVDIANERSQINGKLNEHYNTY